MAAVTAPARVAAQHQSLLHFVGEGRWSDERVLAKVREMVLPERPYSGFMAMVRRCDRIHRGQGCCEMKK